MPELTPRQKLELAVRERFLDMGMPPGGAERSAKDAVHAYYAEEHEHQYHPLVASEATQIMLNVMPDFVSGFRAAFEGVRNSLEAVAQMGQALKPYAEIIVPMQLDRKPIGPQLDASGLPKDFGPHPTDDLTVDDPEPPTSEDIADEVSREDTGRRLGILTPYPRSSHDGPTPHFMFMPDGVADVPRPRTVPVSPPDPSVVVEVTEREFHVAAARRLRELGCSYSELEEMHRRGDFADMHHHSAWFAFGGTINREQLDRANFVLDLVDGPGGFELDDARIEALEERYPTDRITGAPYHVIINGDHDGCGCGGHSPQCQVWSIPYWNHKPSLCLITRTLCLCTPKHTYGQACGEYHEGIGG